MALDLRTITDDELPAFFDCDMTTFGHDAADEDPDGASRLRVLIPPAQRWGVFDGDLVVGTAATFDHAIGLPGGGTSRLAGLTLVAVRPTHRRRGLMSSLVKRHLDDARDRGFAISGLWASEGAIYGRFGYGVAAFGDALSIASAHALRVRLDGEPDTIASLDERAARAQLPAVYAQATARRPGALRRSEPWWRERRFLETPFVRGGASRRRHAIARRGGAAVGYVAYRQRPGAIGGVAEGKIEIIELMGVDAHAEASLWRHVLALDLHPHVTWWNAPVDEALPWRVDDARRIARMSNDTLWLRIEDVAAALAARGYTTDGALRIAVDGVTWQLVTRDGRGHAEPTPQPAELHVSRATLSSLYLGATPASRLARAGLVTGDAAAITRADALFASAIAPWCPEVF